MAIYVWKGKNSFGEKRKGEIEAVDETGARLQLKRLRIDNPIIKVKPKDLFEKIDFFDNPGEDKCSDNQKNNIGFEEITHVNDNLGRNG